MGLTSPGDRVGSRPGGGFGSCTGYLPQAGVDVCSGTFADVAKTATG